MGMIIIAAIACIAVPVICVVVLRYAIRIIFAILSSGFNKAKTIFTETGGMIARTIRGERV